MSDTNSYKTKGRRVVKIKLTDDEFAALRIGMGVRVDYLVDCLDHCSTTEGRQKWQERIDVAQSALDALWKAVACDDSPEPRKSA